MITRTSLADEIDELDKSIKALNESKSEAFDSYRDQMLKAGVGKDNIKKEIDAVKVAIKRRRAALKDEHGLLENEALADEVFHEITRKTRAPRARVENITKITTDGTRYDAETGVIEETDNQSGMVEQAAPVDAAVTAGNDLREPVAAEQGQIIREGDAPRETDRLGDDASSPDTDHEAVATVATALPSAERVTPHRSGSAAANTGGDHVNLEPSANPHQAGALVGNHVPAINERCQKPDICNFSHHPNKITCSPCTLAWAKRMKQGEPA